MNTNMKIRVLGILLCGAVVTVLPSCEPIDDDLDDCEVDFQAKYRVCLVTNENLEIARVLDKHTAIGDDLREHLKDVFTDYGRDIALDFYALPDSSRTMPLRGTLPTEMNAAERSYEIFMPIKDYMHLAATNVQANGAVSLRNADRCHGAQIALTPQPPVKPTSLDEALPSQKTGLFTGRRLLTGLTYGPQQYDMPLYMANSAAAIVIDPRYPRKNSFTDIRIYTLGFAKDFNVCDSAYSYPENDYYVRADQVTLHNTDWLAYCAVSFPSREPSKYTRSRIEIDEPVFRYDDCGENVWYYDCYVTMASGTVTRTIAGVHHPLRAGQLKILVGWMDDDKEPGVIHFKDEELSVSSDLDWREGLIINN